MRFVTSAVPPHVRERRSSAALLLLLFTGAFLLLSRPTQANHGASDERLSLPDGPGSIGGVGENLSASGNMGAMAHRVPLRFPQGFAGATPSLALEYSSMSGNGLVGIGWELPVSHIERFTLRGLPHYDGQDLFAADGSTELVRVATSDGRRVYRARFEGSFIRYTWHDARDGRGGYWEAEYPDGSRGFFGADAQGQEVTSARVRASDRAEAVFRYMLVESVDTFGHRVRYDYMLDGRYPLLQRIAYVFRGGPESTHEPRYQVLFTYERRKDALSNGQPGFDLRLSQRLSAVEVSSLGETLRRYELSYEEARAGTSRLTSVHLFGVGDTAFPAAPTFQYSSSLDLGCRDCTKPFVYDMGRLEATGGGGLDMENGRATLIDINGDALPDLVDTGRHGRHRFFVNTLSEEGTQRFSAPRSSQATVGGSNFILQQPGVQVLDLNGDGFADMLDAPGNRVLCNRGQGDWSTDGFCTGRTLGLKSNLQDDPDVDGEADPRGMRFMDYDGDKRIDLLHTMSNDAARVWHNRADGASFVPVQGTDRVFDRGNLQLADLNGDGLLDLVEISDAGNVWYRLHLGFGRWGTEVNFPLENRQPGETFEKTELQDLNGDGLDDVVFVRGQTVRFALNEAGRFAPLRDLRSADVEGSLPQADNETSVLFADMNGSGTTDIVWVNARDGRVRVLELFALRPNLLTQIDNGLGGIQRVEYGNSTRQHARDRGAELRWRHKLPQALNVVTATERYATASPDVKLRVERTYHHGFYDGLEKRYRGFEKVTESVPSSETQQGSLRELDYDVGATDLYRQGRLTREQVFGAPEGERYPVQRILRTHGDCAVAQARSLDPARPVRHVCEQTVETLLQEGRPEQEWLTLRTEREYDGYGRVTFEAKLGVVGTGAAGAGQCAPCSAPAGTRSGACGERCLGDEWYARIDPIEPGPRTEQHWLLNAVWREQRYSEPEGSRAETLRYFDGPAFQGLPSGHSSHGQITRECQKLSPDAAPDCQGEGWVPATRRDYDAHGNMVGELDPLGQPNEMAGHRRSLRYDDYGLKLLAETVHLSVDGQPYQLAQHREYDPLFNAPSAISRWVLEGAPVASDPAPTRMTYDAFGRRSKIVSPGDTLAAATHQFEYELGAPVSRIVVRSRSKRAALPDLERLECIDGLGRTLQRRTRLGTGLYQVTGFNEVNPQGSPVRVFQGYQGGRACDMARPQAVKSRRYYYDAVGRPLRVTEPDASEYGQASVTTTEYEPLRTSVFDPEDNDPESPAYRTPHRTYRDGLGRVVQLERVLHSDGRASRMRALWDGLGRLAGYLDPEGNRKRQEYDLLGRVLAVHDPNAGTTHFEYDQAGNPVSRTDGRGKIVRTEFDGANRPVAQYDPNDRAGTLAALRYDFAAQCRECTNGEWQTVETHYPLPTSLGGGHDAHGFDLRGQPIFTARSLEGHRFVTRTHYDNANREVRREYPDSTVLQYTYDGASRRSGIVGIVDRVQYDARGLPSGLEFLNGVRQEYAYDARQRLSRTRTVGEDGRVLQGGAYVRDRVDNLLSITDLSDPRPKKMDWNVQFDHDAWYRVRQVNLGGHETLHADFDALDNLRSVHSTAGEGSSAHSGDYAYDAGRPNAVLRAGRLTFDYDGAGLMLDRAGTALHWDYRRRLDHATTARGDTAKYGYDALGEQRVVELHGGGITYHVAPDFEVRDGVSMTYAQLGGRRVARLSSSELATEVLSDPNADGTVRVGDAWLAGQLGEAPKRHLRASARRLLAEVSDDLVLLHADHLGSLTMATGPEGNILGERAFYPTGELRGAAGYVDEYGFTGQRRDPTTGLVHFRFRELDTAVGRWTRPDPLFLVTTAENLAQWGESSTAYAYVAGRWDTFFDPHGLSKKFANLPRVTKLTKPGSEIATFQPVATPGNFSKPRSSRPTLWVSNHTNTSNNLATLVARLHRNQGVRSFTLLTGTHGSANGYAVRSDGRRFIQTDRSAIASQLTPRERSKIRIRYLDMGKHKRRAETRMVRAIEKARPGDHVIAAWCYSDRNRVLVDLYKNRIALGRENISR